MSKQLLAFVAVFAIAACASANRSTRAAGDSGPSVSTAPMEHEHAGHDMAMHTQEATAAAARKRTELAFLFPDGDDKGWSKVENGSGHHMAPDVPLALIPAATRVEMLRQLSLTLDVVRKFPNVKTAEAAGYRRAGPFIPGLGAHFIGGRTNRSGTLTDADILAPSTIIFDGITAESPIAGFMYMSTAGARTAIEPEGFAGPNDKWHFHTGLCLVETQTGVTEVLGFDGSITEASCKAKGAQWQAVSQYMLHVWTVPGYSSALGTFSHTNPALMCPDGTYHTDEHDITNTCRK